MKYKQTADNNYLNVLNDYMMKSCKQTADNNYQNVLHDYMMKLCNYAIIRGNGPFAHQKLQ